jgi:hypothetical protein
MEVIQQWEKLTSEQVSKLMDERRWVFVIPIESHVEGKGYIPSIAIENVKGHFPMTGKGAHAEPWYWGPSYKEAEEQADAKNAEHGINRREAWLIISSTMTFH